jgi:hypothetical protein
MIMNEVLLVCVVGCGQRRNWVESACRVLPGTFSGAALCLSAASRYFIHALGYRSILPNTLLWLVGGILLGLTVNQVFRAGNAAVAFTFEVPEGRRTRTASPSDQSAWVLYLQSINTVNDSIMATVTDLPTHPAQQQFPVAMDGPFQGPESISAGKHPALTPNHQITNLYR